MAAAPAPVPTQASLGSAESFDLAKCTRLFADCSAAAHDVPVLPFLQACEEVKKVVASLGMVLGFASVEISERVAGILARVKDLRQAGAAQGGLAEPQSAAAAAAAAPAAARASSAAGGGGGGAAAGGAPADAVAVRETLQWLVEDEAAHKGAAERNASVSAKQRRLRARAIVWRGRKVRFGGGPLDHFPFGCSPPARPPACPPACRPPTPAHLPLQAARNLYRLTWVLDFIARLLTELVDKPDESLKEAATLAYEAHLAPHHSWVMKKTVAAALLMLPAKEVFLKSLVGAGGAAAGGDGGVGEDAPARVRAFVASFVPLRAALWALFRNLGLCDGRLE
jgi:hypothetical protein